jgi:uncharacterized protein YgiM (DUF1202 family)
VNAVTIRAASVRTAPSRSARLIWTLQRGTEVLLLDKMGDWTYVRFTRKNSGDTQQDGWVDTSLLKQEKTGAE